MKQVVSIQTHLSLSLSLATLSEKVKYVLPLPHICQHLCELQPSRSKLSHTVTQLTGPLKASAYFSSLTHNNNFMLDLILLDRLSDSNCWVSFRASDQPQLFLLMRCKTVTLTDESVKPVCMLFYI